MMSASTSAREKPSVAMAYRSMPTLPTSEGIHGELPSPERVQTSQEVGNVGKSTEPHVISGVF
jgi:hypothetical protein